MKTALRSFLHVALSASLLATLGCEECKVDVEDGDTKETRTGFCSVDRWTIEREADRGVSLDGTIRVNSSNGTVTVKRANRSDVKAEFEGFVFRAFNTPDSEIEANFAQLDTVIDSSDDSSETPSEVVVDIRRKDGAPGSLGADLVLTIPNDFSGTLVINTKNGSTDIDSAANASVVRVNSDNGSIEANISAAETVSLKTDNGRITADADSATDATVETGNGRIETTLPAAVTASIRSGNGGIEAALGVAGTLTIHTDNGDISASFGVVTDDATGGSISADSGDIVLGVPSSGNYAVPATASDSVDFGTPPSGCNVGEAASNSKTLTCNDGGPEFTVTADSGSVTVSYN